MSNSQSFRTQYCSYMDVLEPVSQEREWPIFQTKYARRGICRLFQGDRLIAIGPDRCSHIVLIRYGCVVGRFPDVSYIGLVQCCDCRQRNPTKQNVAVEDVAFARLTYFVSGIDQDLRDTSNILPPGILTRLISASCCTIP
jgi:hypothetical protein